MIAVPMKVSSSLVALPMKVSVHASSSHYDAYGGPYEFTPTQETQVADTSNKVLLENITINPIPNNYGLITWNGSIITVS